MLETTNHLKIKINSEKNFGVVFSVFFLIVAIYPLFFNKTLSMIPLFISIILLLISFTLPKILKIPNKLWFKLGIFLSILISPIVMGIIFYTTVVPTGIIMRILKKDILNEKNNKAKHSFWTHKKKTLTSMKNQF